MTLLAFLQYILAAIALIGLLGLVAYGLTRWVIYTIVWQPWVKVEAVTRPKCTWPDCDQPSGHDYCYEHCVDKTGPTVPRPVRAGKVCGYHDGCPPDGPVCHLCEDLQPTRPVLCPAEKTGEGQS